MYGGFDEVWQTAQCFEDLKITGDPARDEEERLAIRDWCNNPPTGTMETCFGPTKVVNALRLDPAWLFTLDEEAFLAGESALTEPYDCPEEYWETHEYPSIEPYTD